MRRAGSLSLASAPNAGLIILNCACEDLDVATPFCNSSDAFSLAFLRRSRVFFEARNGLDFSLRCCSMWQYVHMKLFRHLVCIQKRHGAQSLVSCLRLPNEVSSPLEFRGILSRMPSFWSSSNVSVATEACRAKRVSSPFCPVGTLSLLTDSSVRLSLSSTACCSRLWISSSLIRMISSKDPDWGGDEASLSLKLSGNDQCFGPCLPCRKSDGTSTCLVYGVCSKESI